MSLSVILPRAIGRGMIVMIAALALSLCGQTLPAAAPEPHAPTLPAQEVGPDDLVGVTVYGAPELSRSVRVDSEGKIRLPMLKRKIPAAGLLPVQLESEISRALEEEQILVAPVVTVGVVEYRSRPISVAGAVRRPVSFQASGFVTLLDALTRAEGLSPGAGPEILVSKARKAGEGATVLVERIPVKELLDTADSKWNIRLTGGEEIRVPEAGKVFVVGNVRKPGAFTISDPAETSVLTMLALSEGLLAYSSDRAYVYRREAAPGGREIGIELKKIMDRSAPDVPLLAGDILYVPEKKGRRATMSAIEKLLIFGSAASAAAIYAGIR